LEALEGFFANLPADSNLAFVVIQHLDPKHKSLMGSLLQKFTIMRIVEIADGLKVEPNCIYLNPPDKNVVILNGTLQLIEPVKKDGLNLSIDCFFRALAEDQKEKPICIILSGTGSEGTLGLKAIKGAGGMTMVQEEHQAKYPGMPGSAIDTGLVDFILPVEKMSIELQKYVQPPYIEGLPKQEKIEAQFENALQKIFVLLRSNPGHDFSGYKEMTIRRRIERRMAVHRIEDISRYVRYLQETPAEMEKLFKDLLIGVTNFFRDPDALVALKDRVLPTCVGSQSAGGRADPHLGNRMFDWGRSLLDRHAVVRNPGDAEHPLRGSDVCLGHRSRRD
jgi:two-component system CheB/CheR fusion protein